MKFLAEKSKIIEGNQIYICIFQLYKSFLLLISDQEEMGIGDVTLSTPSTIEGIKSTAASYNLFGMKEKLLSKIIAEKSSLLLNAPVLTLFFLKNIKEGEEMFIKQLIQFLNEILEEIEKQINRD